MFRGYMQHDSQEFLTYLMDQMHEELKRPVDEEDEAGESGEEEEEEAVKARCVKASGGRQAQTQEVDSGIHRLSIRSSVSANVDGDDSSADSFETCLMDAETTSSDR